MHFTEQKSRAIYGSLSRFAVFAKIHSDQSDLSSDLDKFAIPVWGCAPQINLVLYRYLFNPINYRSQASWVALSLI